ncbi:MAG: LemA family protein [Bacteroidota bacterium]
MEGSVALLIVAGVFVLFVILGYNRLVGLRNAVDKAFASIDAMTKKRYDLIPNLVATVSKYMEHERETLSSITEMRAKAVSGNLTDNEKVDLNNNLSRAMDGIMLAVENYPDLKANQNFLQLQGSLNEIEEQLSASRRAYNAAVTDYNNACQMFPSNVFALLFNFKTRRLFEISEQERQNVDVKTLFG